MSNQKRQSGRTTRMIERARALSAERRAVYIITANAREQKRIGALVKNDRSISVETPGSLGGDGGFDWRTLRGPGMHPNCVVLVDHYAIESRFAAMLEELTRYDAEG